jgi:hypothetical protein
VEDDAMKAFLSWLGDPYLHLLAIGTVVVAIGAAGASRGGDGSELCDHCGRVHDDPAACAPLASKALDDAPIR